MPHAKQQKNGEVEIRTVPGTSNPILRPIAKTEVLKKPLGMFQQMTTFFFFFSVCNEHRAGANDWDLFLSSGVRICNCYKIKTINALKAVQAVCLQHHQHAYAVPTK